MAPMLSTLDVLRQALLSAHDHLTAETLAAVLREIPDELLASEWGRRRGAKTINRSGPTGNWAKHNPNVNNCRCARCHLRRVRQK